MPSRAARLTLYAAMSSLAALALTPAISHAQQAPAPSAVQAAPAVTPATTVADAPTVTNATVGVRAIDVNAVATANGEARLQEEVKTGRPVALMLVGAAGLVVGSVIGDEAGTIIAVTGGVILLYGLYKFLQ